MKRHLAFLLSLLLGAWSAFAQSGETINQLSPGAVLQGTEQIPMYQAANPAVTTTPAAVATYVGGAPRNGINGWVNIKDPRFGATGNGRTDDTAAIQAAIDYAFANGLSAVYCPRGNYVTSDSIWLDPPNNMRATTFTGTGYISGTTLTASTTTGLAIGSHIYGKGVAPDTVIVSGTGPYTVNNSQTVGSSGSPIAMTGNNPTASSGGAGFSFSFFGDPSNNQAYPSCKIYPNFNNGHAIEVGTGAGMYVGHLAIQSSASGYRGAQPSNGVGIAINGGNAGSSPSLIQDVAVSNFYTLINTDTNNTNIMSDTNTMERISGSNAYVGVNFQGSNTYINHVIDPRFQEMDIGIRDPGGVEVNVDGGWIAVEHGKTNSFTMSSVSDLTNGGTQPLGIGPFTFTATLVSPTDPDGFTYVGNRLVYNVWTLATADFGVVPMMMTAWNASRKVGTFQLYQPWVYAEFGQYDLSDNSQTNISNDIANVTTVYVAEMTFTTQGRGVVLRGLTTENEGVCNIIMDVVGGGSTSPTSEVKNIVNTSNPYVFSGNAGTAEKYCQRTMPVIRKSVPGNLILNGGEWSPASGGNEFSQRQTIESTTEPSGIVGRNLWNLHAIFRDGGGAGYAWGQTEPITYTWETEARGIGTWDRSYSLPSLTYGLAPTFVNNSEIASPFCGAEPCPWVTPNLSQSLLALVCPGGNITSCGKLPTFRSYFPIACRTVFKSVDWNTGGVSPSSAPSTLYLRSNSCPGYSWGQNITDATVSAYKDAFGLADAGFTGSISGTVLTVSSGTGISVGDYLSDNGIGNVMSGTYVTGGSGTSWTVNTSQSVVREAMYATKPVAWSHIGKSPVLYLDTSTLSLMFPGLGFTLDSGDGSGAIPYIVTGVYEDLGYVTVIRADQNAGGLLAGNTTQVYSCTSSCTIGQASFSWTAY